jgi:peroxiredoxin Q/BCP
MGIVSAPDNARSPRDVPDDRRGHVPLVFPRVSGESAVMLVQGDKAPDFTLEGTEGKVTLSSVIGTGAAGKYVVLFFYPRDKTPGCTREGQAFSALRSAFAKAGARVYGISKDSLESHASYAESAGITVPLLSDPDLTVHRKYGAYGEKTMYGKKVLGTIRSTFVIGKDGKLARVFPNVKVDGHADAVLSALEKHASGSEVTATEGPAAKAGRGSPAKKAAQKTRSAR